MNKPIALCLALFFFLFLPSAFAQSIKYDFDSMEVVYATKFEAYPINVDADNWIALLAGGTQKPVTVLYGIIKLKKEDGTQTMEEFIKVSGENGSNRFLLNSSSRQYYDASATPIIIKSFFWSAKKLEGDTVVKDFTLPIYSITFIRHFNEDGDLVSFILSGSNNGQKANEDFWAVLPTDNLYAWPEIVVNNLEENELDIVSRVSQTINTIDISNDLSSLPQVGPPTADSGEDAELVPGIEVVKNGEETNHLELTNIKPFNKESRQSRIDGILRFGKDIGVEGTVEVIIVDDFDNLRSENRYIFRRNNGKRSRAYFPEGLSLTSGKLRISGKEFTEKNGKSEIVVEEYVQQEQIASSSEEENLALGEQKTVVILVNSYEDPIETITVEEAGNRFFNEGNPNSVTSWIKEVSYEKAWLTGDVFGWYTLPRTRMELCGDDPVFFDELLSDVISASDADIDFSNYLRVIIVFPLVPIPCFYGGAAYGVGELIPITTLDGEINVTVNYLNSVARIDNGAGSHELGHQFGAWHANFRDCGDETVGDNCISEPYGDAFDNMGYDSLGFSPTKNHFNAFHKEKMGWLNSSQIQNYGAPGTYSVEPIETMSPGIKAIKILLPDGTHYYVEYRRPIGFDQYMFNGHGNDVPGIYDGAMLHWDQFTLIESGDTELLDAVPRTDVGNEYLDSLDVVLRLGETFYDAINGLAFTVTDMTENNLQIDISPVNCGNGVIDHQIEECDDGNEINGDGCDSMCRTEVCGNGKLQYGEECDDGNEINGDGCNAICVIEYCGDDVIQTGIREQCEGLNLGENDCSTVGFAGGDLFCTSDCMFNTSNCFGPICGEGHDYNNSTNVCTAVIPVGTQSGYLSKLSEVGDWNEVRNASIADEIITEGTVYSLANFYHFTFFAEEETAANRISLPFNTSTIPSDAEILSGELIVHMSTMLNSHREGRDFISLVQTSLANSPELALDDFDQFGSVDNPIEGSRRIDISEELSAGGKEVGLVLNAEGKSWIDKSGWTTLGLRGGYDILGVPDPTEDYVLWVFLDGESSDHKPTLIVDYSVPIECINLDDCGFGEVCKDGACIEQVCFDTDGGLDIFRKGSTWTDVDNVWTDACVGASQVEEGYCEVGIPVVNKVIEDCPDVCKDGECVSIEINKFEGTLTPEREGWGVHFLFGEGEAVKTLNEQYIVEVTEITQGRAMIDIYEKDVVGDYVYVGEIMAFEEVTSSESETEVAVIVKGIDSDNKQITSLEITGTKEFSGEVDYMGDGPHTNVEKGQSIKLTSGSYILEISKFKVEGTTNYVQIKIYHKSFGEYEFAGYILALEGVQSSRGSLSVTVTGINPENGTIDSIEVSE